ncbi:DUF3291 domain-containing protein [Litoribacter alkaliphilus]|uniref:DUF3291 domain-containing protein n=1 Tax=Litoribacter ruber TaxID=702568 RepID=A0AAP2CHD8_9BACT|nr:DUF3291 domain-containing protein [Litoribacter alkaliphilus]MBS9523271.1 DUF3291 domain-containing protein [Litoribacter alkaliphilus]
MPQQPVPTSRIAKNPDHNRLKTMSKSLVSFSFFNFPFAQKWWALRQMQHSDLEVPGASFAKLLGSGGGSGFSIKPDFGTYVIMCIWDSAEKAKAWESTDLFSTFASKSHSHQTHWMSCLQSYGCWEDGNPFQNYEMAAYTDGPVFALTRASIDKTKLLAFWRNVPVTTKALYDSPGLIFAKGIGQFPLVEQATFSQWKDLESMKNFAYQSDHKQVLKMANKEGWFREDLFARFIPVDINDL